MLKIHNVYLDSAEIKCKPNRVTLGKIYGYLKKNNHIIVDNPSIADFIIINTCGLTDSHEKRSLKIFNTYLKRTDAKIISIGCLNKINEGLKNSFGKKIHFINNLKELDQIFYRKVRFSDNDWYVPGDISIKLSKSNRKSRKFLMRIYPYLSFLFSKSNIYQSIYNEIKHKNKSYVMISNGCLGNCSYCIIKKARGNLVSRKPKEILEDIKKIYNPHENLCIVADDCGCYGLDLGLNLPTLLEKINKKYPNLKIDIPYLNPNWLIKDEKGYFNILNMGNIKSIGIPIQSGSNEIITKMNRNYDINHIIKLVRKIKELNPDIFIWTQIIVGFPGETHKDFKKTINVMKDFDAANIFAYSDRKGTKSFEFKNKNSKIVILTRYWVMSSLAVINSLSRMLKEIKTKNKAI